MSNTNFDPRPALVDSHLFGSFHPEMALFHNLPIQQVSGYWMKRELFSGLFLVFEKGFQGILRFLCSVHISL